MTDGEAEALATVVRESVAADVVVERDGRYFVVVVDAPSGRYTVRDEADWRWLRGRIDRG
jgi:hypothetical protein